MERFWWKGRPAYRLSRILMFTLFGALLLAPAPVRGQDESPLRVAVHHAPPFLIKESDDNWSGFGLDLWRAIAEDLDLDYELVEVEASEQLDQLEAGQIDLVLMAAVSTEGEERIDYTHSYFADEIGFTRQRSTTVMQTIEAILSPRFLASAFWVGVVLVLVGLAVWLFERRDNAEMFGDRWHHGAWSGFWWAAVTLTTIGYGDKVPQTLGGRLVALAWMLAALVLSAILTATITSVLAFGPATRPLNFPDDLRNKEVAAIGESGPAALLKEERISFASYEDVEQALEAIGEDNIEFVVHYVAALRFVQNQIDSVLLETRSLDLLPQQIAFALSEEDERIEELNQVLVKIINEPGWHDIVTRYVETSLR